MDMHTRPLGYTEDGELSANKEHQILPRGKDELTIGMPHVDEELH